MSLPIKGRGRGQACTQASCWRGGRCMLTYAKATLCLALNFPWGQNFEGVASPLVMQTLHYWLGKGEFSIVWAAVVFCWHKKVARKGEGQERGSERGGGEVIGKRGVWGATKLEEGNLLQPFTHIHISSVYFKTITFVTCQLYFGNKFSKYLRSSFIHHEKHFQ